MAEAQKALRLAFELLLNGIKMAKKALMLESALLEELVKRLKGELEFYEAVIDKFRRKYSCTLEELETRIERDGVPVENHEVWEDSIEWRNATEEAERTKRILERLRA